MLKKIINDNPLACVIFIGSLLAIWTIHSAKVDAEKNLTNACSSYAGLIETVRNESFKENWNRSKNEVTELAKLPDSKTDEGKLQYQIIVYQNTIQDACNSVFGPLPSFPL